MRGSKHHLAGLASLHQLSRSEQRRTSWRQSMATLAEIVLEARGVPLEGMNPEQLLLSVRTAMAEGLIDDLGFLSSPAAACALYGLASALPLGPERRDLGRRVLVCLHEGDANTFVALASAVALGSTRAFEGPGMRARVALSLTLPVGTGVHADALALSLLSCRELLQRWLVEPSTGALPARRMAARLLERAAREAARRAVHGDDGGVWLFESHTVQTAWTHLMGDREPLVWRHVAAGRGLLSAVVPRFAEEVERDLAAASSSRGRRGVASLAASVAIRPSEALARAHDVLDGPMLQHDPGIAAAMVYGLPRAGEVEREAAEELLLAAAQKGGSLVAEALLDLRREWFGTSFGLRAAEAVRAQLQQRAGKGADDDGHAALMDLLCRELGCEQERGPSLPDVVYQALTAFADVSARAAYDRAREALAIAEQRVSRLEALNEDEGSSARHEVFRILHELDVGLLESSALCDLLSLGSPSQDPAKQGSQLQGLLVRLQTVLMARETRPHGGGEAVPHLTMRMHRLRTVLHLLDTRQGDEQTTEVRAQRLEAVRALFHRVERDAPSAMDRIVHASLARGLDGLVRDEVFELSDIVLLASCFVPTPEGFSALTESSMLPEVKQCLRALASLVRTQYKAPPGAEGQGALIDALTELSRALPAESSARTEGLRASLVRLSLCLRHLVSASCLRELMQDRRALELLELAVPELVQLSSAARRRLGEKGFVTTPTSGHGVWSLGLALERAVHRGDRAGLELVLEALGDSLRAELPPVFAHVIGRMLEPLLERPLDPPTRTSPPRALPVSTQDRPLPAWLPPARVLGDFYVLRPVGAEAGGTVFVVNRLEQRHDPHAPKLALKVPEYDGSTARVLSQQQFVRMFREEAGALLAVPPHENLATFISFDANAKPRPILVTELVEGPTLERELAKNELDCTRGLDLIHGILAGLEALHVVGVGHLDLKPSNVIVRVRENRPCPVLVDFGLAGRHLRPGCGRAHYAAPELLLDSPYASEASPMAADVYALGCVAFEIMTGQVLFHARDEPAVLAAHGAHDGRPAGVLALAAQPGHEGFADWLSTCLRRDPSKRAPVELLMRTLPAVRSQLTERTWPLPVRRSPSF